MIAGLEMHRRAIEENKIRYENCLETGLEPIKCSFQAAFGE